MPVNDRPIERMKATMREWKSVESRRLECQKKFSAIEAKLKKNTPLEKSEYVEYCRLREQLADLQSLQLAQYKSLLLADITRLMKSVVWFPDGKDMIPDWIDLKFLAEQAEIIDLADTFGELTEPGCLLETFKHAHPAFGIR